MRYPGFMPCKPKRLASLALILLLGICGCSGSTDPDSTDSGAGNSQPAVEPDGNGLDDASAPEPTPVNPESEPAPVSPEPAPVAPDPEPEGPAPPATTRVHFGITVPAYVSNELQVQLVWGDIEISAQWVGDEFWSTTIDLPADTEHALVVTFFDRNGGISLGTVDRVYRTGVNSAEDVSITSTDFDTARWDDDSDGVSNIDELRQASDPLVSDVPGEPESDNLLDTFGVYSLVGYPAGYYEPELLTHAFPIDIHEEQIDDNLPYTSETTTRDIEISADGNGSYNKNYDFFIALDAPFHRSSTAIRIQQGDTVSWSGTELLRGSSRYYGYTEEVFETSNTLSGRELVQQSSGTVTRKKKHYDNKANIIRYQYELVLDLDSMDTENTCAVLRGNITQSFERQIEDTELTEETVSRDSADENWRWTKTLDGEFTQGEAIDVNQRFYCNYLIK